MKTSILKRSTPKTKLGLLAAVASMTASSQVMATAGSGEIKWSEALGATDNVSKWLRAAVVIVMAIFLMVSLILGSLAFKQLAADGNWKDFWSKIAGAVGMFVVPTLVYWFAKLP